MSGDNKKRKKIFLLFIFILITSVILAVGTYAWFVGLSTVNTSQFNISISSGSGLEISLDGDNWKKNDQVLTISSSTITSTSGSGDHAYVGNTNSWVDSGGLVPISSPGTIDTSTGRLTFFEKSSLASTAGGYRLVATQIDNSTTEVQSYVVFDLFIKNGNDNVYSTSNHSSDAAENIYLKNDSAATVNGTNYGAANSLRVGFYSIAGMKSYRADVSDITALSCSTTNTTTRIKICTSASSEKAVHWNVWEPNHASHTSNVLTYFDKSCRKRDSNGEYLATHCTALGENTNTYSVKDEIDAGDNVDIYDGLNDYTGSSSKLDAITTYKTPDTLDPAYSDNNQILKLAGNSITKVRVYIWLEGQDPDNYDIISQDLQLTVKFGFTKDRFQINT